MTVKFHLNLQNPENSHIVIVDVSSSSSNCSWLTRKKIVIGSIAGVAVATATAYFFINKALTETAFSSNTTETSTSHNVFSDRTQLLVNQSSLSLYNITRLVEKPPSYFDNCVPAFQSHLNLFKTCGVSVCNCMRNAGEVFKFLCNTYALGVIEEDECEKASIVMETCRERSC